MAERERSSRGRRRRRGWRDGRIRREPRIRRRTGGSSGRRSDEGAHDGGSMKAESSPSERLRARSDSHNRCSKTMKGDGGVDGPARQASEREATWRAGLRGPMRAVEHRFGLARRGDADNSKGAATRRGGDDARAIPANGARGDRELAMRSAAAAQGGNDIVVHDAMNGAVARCRPVGCTISTKSRRRDGGDVYFT
ncbi:hypothetical protein Scep_019779 [Stephania cephalantha]|uniref:Uncharacterized protein n=1 Tax=Stephania cephalantha TaxID=152367 RepID=A0AAP0IBT3_9MAGN